MHLKKKQNDFYITETKYQEQMDGYVLPFLKSFRTAETFNCSEHKIAYHAYRLNTFSRTIVISHGFAERKEKYYEMIYYFLKMGYQVFVLDHYGHGDSIEKIDDPSLVYIKEFSQYVEDLNHFISFHVKPYSDDKPIVLYGHSMGACIAALLAEQFPEKIDGLILSSPMFSINTVVPQSLSAPVSHLSVLMNAEKNYVLGFRSFNPEKDGQFNARFAATSSDNRAEYSFLANLDYSDAPSWGPSWNWLYESLKASETVIQKENVEQISVPILMFQAEKDWIVLPDGQQTFITYAKDIKALLIGESRHEIYLEKDAIVWNYFNKINNFIEERII